MKYHIARFKGAKNSQPICSVCSFKWLCQDYFRCRFSLFGMRILEARPVYPGRGGDEGKMNANYQPERINHSFIAALNRQAFYRESMLLDKQQLWRFWLGTENGWRTLRPEPFMLNSMRFQPTDTIDGGLGKFRTSDSLGMSRVKIDMRVKAGKVVSR